MDPDLLATLHPTVQEFLTAPPGTCLTIAVSGNSDLWVQLLGDNLNAAYPHQAAPSVTMPALLASPLIKTLQSYEAGTFVTLTVHDMSDPALLPWIEDYFVTILAQPRGQFEVDLRFDQF
jgi:hypothetical protein